MPFIKKTLIGFAFLYLVVCVSMFLLQRQLVFVAPQKQETPSSDFLRTDVAGGTFYYSPKLTPTDSVCVFFHGNAGQSAGAQWIAPLLGSGVKLVAVEYPGYMGAPGEPTEETVYDSAEKALNHLIDIEKIQKNNVTLLGNSLGSGVAVEMARRGYASKMVLVSAYTALPDVAAKLYWYLPVKLLMKDKFDSLSKASSLQMPVLLIHGTEDRVIPIEFGRTLGAQIKNSSFVEVKEAGHNNIWDFPETQQALESFLMPRANSN
jgi:uncharacterized protein